MQGQGFTEKDWQLFRNKRIEWQEAYMDRLNKEYIKLLTSDADPSEKFWTLEKRIREDKKDAGVQMDMSRSQLLGNIMSLLDEGAIVYDDLEEFSDQLKETIGTYLKRVGRL